MLELPLNDAPPPRPRETPNECGDVGEKKKLMLPFLLTNCSNAVLSLARELVTSGGNVPPTPDIGAPASPKSFEATAGYLLAGGRPFSRILISLPKTKSRMPRSCVFCKGGSDTANPTFQELNSVHILDGGPPFLG